MSTFSATANSNSTIGYAQYGSSSWSTGSSSGACQGAYQGTTAAKSRVGVMVFSGAGTALKGKLIQSITLTITSSGRGFRFILQEADLLSGQLSEPEYRRSRFRAGGRDAGHADR